MKIVDRWFHKPGTAKIVWKMVDRWFHKPGIAKIVWKMVKQAVGW